MTGDADQVLQQVDRPLRTRRSWLTVPLLPTPKRTPFTFFYLALLLGTTLFLQFGNPALGARLLELSSTDAHNLWRRPLFALLTSAFWVSDGTWLPYAVIFAVAVAPLERRFGALHTMGVFFSGHVLATLATELPVMWAIRTGDLPRVDGHWLDIGVSYGFFTTAGALVFLLAGRARLWALLTMEVFIVLFYVTDDPTTLAAVVTLLGHTIAAHLGLFFWGPRLRRRSLARAQPGPDLG
ncbi:rhomboid-like protein [Amycolatopsis sp.]|jgi:hypothetical protein|uniref:rhomboid-like protein n=1 Tax=Amycolatopsis sp. TaxID=37632 RepID=UPI002E004469|nr:rhomboid-like protein [Amycolatopsis sp.]